MKRLETMRSELREAYALFIGSYSKLMFVAFQMARARLAIHEQRIEALRRAESEIEGGQDAYSVFLRAGSSATKERDVRLSEQFNSLYVDTHVELARVILLDDDEDRRRFLEDLLTKFLEPPRNRAAADLEDLDEHRSELRKYSDDLVRRRWRFDEFVVRLAGRFAAKHWSPDAADGVGTAKLTAKTLSLQDSPTETENDAEEAVGPPR